MRHLYPLLGWLVLLTAIIAVMAAHVEPEKEQIGERTIYFALDSDDEATVHLLADESLLRILAHLETPEPGTLDETTTWLYGLRFTIDPVGGEPSSQEHWTRSRLTIIEEGLPAILGPRPGWVVTDSRIMELDPGPRVPQGGELRIEPLLEHEDQRVMIRVYRERESETFESYRIASSPEARKERLEGILPLGWEALVSGERKRIAGWTREFLSVSSLTGESVALRRLGSPSSAPTALNEGFRLDSGQATAVNLRGPCTLHVNTVLEHPPPGEEDQRVPLSPEIVDASARPHPPPEQPGPYQFRVPEGAIWSFRWHNPWTNPPVLMRFRVAPRAGRSWGEPPGAGGEQPQAPEIRRLTNFYADEHTSPVLVPVATGRDYGALTVEARPRPDEVWLGNPEANPEPDPVTVTFTAYDDEGRYMGAGSFRAEFSYTPFERYVEEEAPYMSESTRIHVFHSYRASTVAFNADGPVDLRFLVPMNAEPVQAPEYGLPEGWYAAYAPWELAPYVSISPINLPDLVQAGRLVRFEATVRPERRGAGAAETRHHTQLVEPLGDPPRYPLAERHRKDRPWEDWHRTRLEDETTLKIPAHGELAVDYRVPPRSVNQTAFLKCGAAEAAALVVAAGGTLHFADLPPGEQTCTRNFPPGEYLARAEGSGERWVRRTVYRGDRAPLQLQVPTVAGEKARVYVRAYAPVWADPPTLEVQVDGGEPRRHGGPSTSLTRAMRTASPPPAGHSARLEDRARGDLTAYQGLRIVLGDDLLPGMHRLRVRTVWEEDQERFPVYLRFDATRAPVRPTHFQHWAVEAQCELEGT